MGQWDRHGAYIVIDIKDGIVTQALINRPISSNLGVWEENSFALSGNKDIYNRIDEATYTKENVMNQRVNVLYTEKSTTKTEDLSSILTEFILQHRNDLEIETAINGKSVSYKEFCSALEKSDMLLSAKGLSNSNATVSNENSNTSKGVKNPDVVKKNVIE